MTRHYLQALNWLHKQKNPQKHNQSKTRETLSNIYKTSQRLFSYIKNNVEKCRFDFVWIATFVIAPYLIFIWGLRNLGLFDKKNIIKCIELKSIYLIKCIGLALTA